MFKKMWAVGVSLGLIFSAAGPAWAQEAMTPEQFYLNQASAEKFASLRKAARSSFYGILLYPKDIRDAVLELSKYPDLLFSLGDKEKVKTYPEPAQQAVKTLEGYSDVTGIMKQHLVVSALLGEVYKEKGQEIVDVVDRLSVTVNQNHEAAVRSWTEKLEKDPEALKELQRAAEAYAKENKLPSPNQPQPASQGTQVTHVYNQYGYYVNPQGQVVVNDLPSSEMMNYMMLNSLVYFALTAAVVSHHGHYHEDYYWEMYDDAWNRYEDYWDEQMNDLEDQIDEIAGDREDKRQEYQERVDEIKQEREERQQGRQERPAAQPATERLQQRPSPTAQPAWQQGGAGSKVKFDPPSRDFQVNRARDFHSQSWGQRGGGGGFQRSGGGASSGGFQRSGGGSFGGGARSGSSFSGGGRRR
jgi:uncharacterized membrane protein YgcG